tara:strand:+ start:219 stop:458 length:240 start_codon:yes stop_codon:yes gene_type:complete
MKNSHFNRGDKLILCFNDKASSRTKGRIREHGPLFVFFKETTSFPGAGLLSHRECVLVGSLSTGWDGWLPCDELKIEKG